MIDSVARLALRDGAAACSRRGTFGWLEDVALSGGAAATRNVCPTMALLLTRDGFVVICAQGPACGQEPSITQLR